MNITDLMHNFYGLFKASFPFLLKAGVEVGDDEWDDLFELAFQVVVSVSIERQLGQMFEYCYGSWISSDKCEFQIRVRAKTGDPVLAGKIHTSPNGSISVRHYETILPSSPVEFLFREFGHPLKDTSAKDWSAYVFGEVVGANQPLAAGTVVCVPVEACEFVVWRLPQ